MRRPKESMRLHSEPAVEDAQRPLNRNATLEEKNATQDHESFVEHVIGLLHRVVAAFREDKKP
jgi:hypothetical protein